MIINPATKTIQTKIVYYGPAMSGKTTMLKALFKLMGYDNGMSSIETTEGRTLFFDFGSLDLQGKEWTIKLNLYSATGQDFYKSTRPATLHGANAIVFVVDSQANLLKYNVESWQELKKFFPESMKKKVPIVICLNKQDLKERILLVNQETIESEFKVKNDENVTIITSIATEGKGVKEAFSIIMNKLFPKFKLDL